MTVQTEIATSRLVLKSITPALIHELFGHKTEEELMAFFGVDEKGYARLQAMHEKGMETDRLSMFYFLLHEKGTNRILGECGFHTWNKIHKRAEIFYSLRSDKDKRKGLMKEALASVLAFGFTELDLHRVAALVASYNIPSIRLLDHYGFTKEGTLREDYVVDGKSEDSDCYSLLKWEWEGVSRHS